VPDLILASTSPYRRALLERLGVPFRCLAPRVDEEMLKTPGVSPCALAELLARAKAQSLAEVEPTSVIVGSDQLVAFEGRIFGKPGDAASAVEQLLEMAGRPHELITALAVWHRGDVIAHTDVATLCLRQLSRPEAERYVAADAPFDCAGGYKIESRGIALFHRIEAEDFTAITGLPLITLASILRGRGFAIP
jgi:septum formation protein